MANTLTGLIPTIYDAMDIVAREMVGFIPAVFKNSSAARAAKDETIRYPIAPANSAGGNITPGADPADDGDQTIGYADMSISKSRYWPVRLTGEESQGLGNAPGLNETVMRDRFAQAIRAAVNEVEADLAALYKYASRACKTTGLRLFDETDGTESLAQLRRILYDNGAQGQELHLVLGSSAGARVRGSKVLVEVDRSGSPELLRSGVIGLPLFGMAVHESAQIGAHTNGVYTAPVVTDLALNGVAITGTGLDTLLAGDLLKIANDDDNVYVLNATPGSAVAAAINAPGSRVAHSGATDAISPLIATRYYPNMAFARNAIHLVTRLPAMPDAGDSASDSEIITDPISGLSFEVREYRQYHRVKYEVCLAWGVKAVKPEFIALLAE
jgi:hypothetical protein